MRAPAALALLCWLGGGSAHAAEPARFRYDAAAGCPSEEEFVGRVRERSLHERTAAPDELARQFVVTLGADEAGWLGRVEFVDADGTPVTRAVRGENCDEVASGVALVTALAIDGRAEPDSRSDAVPTPPPLALAEKQEAPVVRAPEREAPRAPPPVASAAFLSAGFGGGFQSWLGPSGGPSLAAFLSYAADARGPSLRLSASHWRASAAVGEREAAFRAWGARLDGCPWVLEAHGVFATPCLGFDLGLLRAEGLKSSALPVPHTDSVLWRDVEVLGRVGVLLGGLVFLEGEAALAIPLFRHDFGFEQPKARLFSVPALGGAAEAHVGVRFP